MVVPQEVLNVSVGVIVCSTYQGVREFPIVPPFFLGCRGSVQEFHHLFVGVDGFVLPIVQFLNLLVQFLQGACKCRKEI